MAEWLGNGLQNHAQQFDSAWHLYLLVISFSVINYVVSMRGPHVSGDNLFFFMPCYRGMLFKPRQTDLH